MHLTDSNHNFSSTISNVLTEHRRVVHIKLIDNNCNIAQLVAGDIGISQTAVQNNTSKNKVVQLSYQVRDLLCIVRYTVRGDYFVR